MTTLTAAQIPDVFVGEVRLASVDFQGALDSGELLTGTPTVSELTTADLTFSNEAVNTAALTVDGVSVAVGQGVQFKFSGQQAGVTYEILVTCATDATPAQALKRKIRFIGVATT